MIVSAAATHPGKVRDLNEDCFEANDKLGLWLVADGVGGHARGEVASEMVRSTLVDKVAAGRGLVDSIKAAHSAVLHAAGQMSDARGMGSTVVAARVNDNDYQIAWVGDSRAYLFNTALQQLSVDHSYVQMLLEDDLITVEEARTHPEKNIITQSVGEAGIKELDVGVCEGKFRPGDILLLCSDGLNDEIDDSAIVMQLQQANSLEEKANCLIASALESGGRDNCTVVLIKYDNPENGSQVAFPQPHSDAAGRQTLRFRVLAVLVIVLAIALMLTVF